MRKWDFAIAAAIGAVVFTIIGYFVYAVPGGDWSFAAWISRPVAFRSWPWPLLGAAIGCGVYFLARRR